MNRIPLWFFLALAKPMEIISFLHFASLCPDRDLILVLQLWENLLCPDLQICRLFATMTLWSHLGKNKSCWRIQYLDCCTRIDIIKNQFHRKTPALSQEILVNSPVAGCVQEVKAVSRLHTNLPEGFSFSDFLKWT